jgi:hypothetical protein
VGAELTPSFLQGVAYQRVSVIPVVQEGTSGGVRRLVGSWRTGVLKTDGCVRSQSVHELTTACTATAGTHRPDDCCQQCQRRLPPTQPPSVRLTLFVARVDSQNPPTTPTPSPISRPATGTSPTSSHWASTPSVSTPSTHMRTTRRASTRSIRLEFMSLLVSPTRSPHRTAVDNILDTMQTCPSPLTDRSTVPLPVGTSESSISTSRH